MTAKAIHFKDSFPFFLANKPKNKAMVINTPGGSIKEVNTFWRKNPMSLLPAYFLCYANYSKFKGGFQ